LATNASCDRRGESDSSLSLVAASDGGCVLYMTIEELEHLNEELTAVLLWALRVRLTDLADRPVGVAPFEMLVLSHVAGSLLPEG
jgi:hypothetical protein